MEKLPTRKAIRLSRDAYQQSNAFSITIATHERHPWFQLHPELAGELTQLLGDMAGERQTLLFAWCIMPNHLHLLLQDTNIIDFVRLLKGKLTAEARRLETGLALWQRSFYDHALRKEESLGDVARYIWNNPVRAGIVDRASAYSWSGSLVWTNWREFADQSAGEKRP
jgi:REP element-mobilizing transposase RayT